MSAFRKLALTCGVASMSVFGQLPGIDGVAAPPVPLNIAQQNIRCAVSAQPLTVRVEGLAELLGDIVVNCTGNLAVNPRNFVGVLPVGYATAAAVMPTINIQVTLSTPVTSRLVSDPLTEALVFVDDATIATALPPGAVDTRLQNPCTGGSGVCTTWVSDGSTPLVAGVVGAGSATDPLTGAASSTADGRGVLTNVWQGSRLNSQTIVFNSVPLGFVDSRGNPRLRASYLAAAAASPGGIYDGRQFAASYQKTYRIKNLRSAVAGNASVNSQIFAYVGIQNPAGTLQVDSASTVVGQVNTGLTTTLRNADGSGFSGPFTLAACVTINRDLAVDPTDADPYNGATLSIRFNEGYAVAFRPRGFVPGQATTADQNLIDFNYNTESGFYSQLFPATNGLRIAGIADHGTRLRAVWNNIPANVRIYTFATAQTGATSGTIGAYAVVTDASGGNPAPITVPSAPTALFATAIGGAAIPAGSFVLTTATNGLINVAITSGRAVQVWEVYTSSPLVTETIAFPTIVAYRAGNNPGVGTVTLQGTFAPINTTAAAGGTLVPIPRFVETGSAANAFSIAPCLTNLLFPFVTNQAGFNTGIAISNTSLTNPGTGELFGTDVNNGIAPQSGTCTLNYFGTTGADGAAPPPATTGVIPAGRTFVMTLASGSSGPFGTVPAALNFQGYMIAQCNFRYAHGYAFISDIGAVQLAQGYLALIMDAAIGTRTGNASETLGQ